MSILSSGTRYDGAAPIHTAGKDYMTPLVRIFKPALEDTIDDR